MGSGKAYRFPFLFLRVFSSLFSWRDLRRSATRYLWDKGLNLAEIQLIGGWKDPRVLLNTYTHLDPVKLARKL